MESMDRSTELRIRLAETLASQTDAEQLTKGIFEGAFQQLQSSPENRIYPGRKELLWDQAWKKEVKVLHRAYKDYYLTTTLAKCDADHLERMCIEHGMNGSITELAEAPEEAILAQLPKTSERMVEFLMGARNPPVRGSTPLDIVELS